MLFNNCWWKFGDDFVYSDMANATLRYQTNKNPQGKRILFLECLLDKGFDDC